MGKTAVVYALTIGKVQKPAQLVRRVDLELRSHSPLTWRGLTFKPCDLFRIWWPGPKLHLNGLDDRI